MPEYKPTHRMTLAELDEMLRALKIDRVTAYRFSPGASGLSRGVVFVRGAFEGDVEGKDFGVTGTGDDLAQAIGEMLGNARQAAEVRK